MGLGVAWRGGVGLRALRRVLPTSLRRSPNAVSATPRPGADDFTPTLIYVTIKAQPEVRCGAALGHWRPWSSRANLGWGHWVCWGRWVRLRPHGVYSTAHLCRGDSQATQASAGMSSGGAGSGGRTAH